MDSRRTLPHGLPLCPIRRRILEYIAKAIRNHDRSPTIREIGEAFGIASTN
jgi:SOS-response transcriptional repressor LexA